MTQASSAFKGFFAKPLPKSERRRPPTYHKLMQFTDLLTAASFTIYCRGQELIDVSIADHQTTYLIPDIDTLWRGGLGSFALTAAAIAQQDEATQAAIRAALERRAEIYRTTTGLKIPVAFKVGAGRKS